MGSDTEIHGTWLIPRNLNSYRLFHEAGMQVVDASKGTDPDFNYDMGEGSTTKWGRTTH